MSSFTSTSSSASASGSASASASGRPKVNLRSTAVKRIMQEASELANADIEEDGFVAAPLENDIFEWHCTMRGVQGSEFEGGLYHLRILLPPSYPMSAPDIMLLTPNGRFELGKKICIDGLTSFHAGSWQPAWGVRTAVLGLRSFWMQSGEALSAIGALDYSKAERRRLAGLSRGWKCPSCRVKNEEIIPPASAVAPQANLHVGPGTGTAAAAPKEKRPDGMGKAGEDGTTASLNENAVGNSLSAGDHKGTGVDGSGETTKGQGGTAASPPDESGFDPIGQAAAKSGSGLSAPLPSPSPSHLTEHKQSSESESDSARDAPIAIPIPIPVRDIDINIEDEPAESTTATAGAGAEDMTRPRSGDGACPSGAEPGETAPAPAPTGIREAEEVEGKAETNNYNSTTLATSDRASFQTSEAGSIRQRLQQPNTPISPPSLQIQPPQPAPAPAPAQPAQIPHLSSSSSSTDLLRPRPGSTPRHLRPDPPSRSDSAAQTAPLPRRIVPVWLDALIFGGVAVLLLLLSKKLA